MPSDRPSSSNKRLWLTASLVIAGFALLLALISRAHPLPESLLRASRWALAVALFGYGCVRRSLMTWIFVSMVIGGIAGYDFPHQAVALQVITQIFLRLIKTIIAPLIFSTLVVGIAGHSDVKQVGRMGVKALIFFEVITTLALAIGLVAINVSKAGVGLRPPEEQAQPAISVQHQSASDVVLHVFPENIAKSIAEGQVLQVVVFALLFALALSMLPPPRRAPILSLCENLSETMF